MVALLLLPSVFCACSSRREPGPSLRYALIGFENLSGDASLDWVGPGAAEFLSHSLLAAMDAEGGGKVTFADTDAIERISRRIGAHGRNTPGISASRSSAIVAGANRIIEGYIERTASGVQITASEEDPAAHHSVRTLSATAASAFDALGKLTHEFSSRPGPPGTANAEAFRSYCEGLGAAPSDAVHLFEHAAALDPAFGRAWVDLALTYVALGDAVRASAIIGQAHGQKLAPADEARLDFEAASLRGDRTAVVAAKHKMFELSAGDTELGRSLAEDEIAAGNFGEAAAVWKKQTVDSPEDANAWNQLGYTLGWSGDYPGALTALREYARLRPNDANPLDSQGDVHYWFRKYSDAAASYSAAYAKAPDFLNGGDLYKAAWAKYFSGDQAGADALYEKFRSIREKAGNGNDQAIILFTGDWLYRTGRQQAALTLLRDASKKEPAEQPAIRAAIASQLAIWDLLAGNRAGAAGDVAVGASPVARFVALPTATASEWETRSVQRVGEPQFAGLRLLALGYALILDGKKQTAVPVWEQIVKQSPANDFFPRTVLARLQGQPTEHAAPPDPLNLNPFACVLDKL